MMINEDLEKKAEKYATEDLPDGYTRINLQKKEAYIAGAKAMQKENDTYWQNIITEQHKYVEECRIKVEEENVALKGKILELLKENEQQKKQIERLKELECDGCMEG